MKLVELLAKQIAEWPEGAEHAIQDDDGCFKFGAGKNPKIYSDGILVRDIEIEHELYNGFHSSEKTSDRKSAIVTREQWQAERNRQKGGEWKRHRGGKCPVPAGTKVSTRHRDGEVVDVHFQTAEYGTHKAVMDCVWKHDGSKHDIMAYKVISQPQAEEVKLSKAEVRAQFMPEPEFVYLEPKTDQIDGPIKWRDTVNELDAYIEEFTRERESLINRLALEGFALLPAMTAVMGVSDDMNFWESWRVGDIIKVTNDHDIDDGQYAILEIEDAGYEGELPVKTYKGWPDTEYATLEFVSRP